MGIWSVPSAATNLPRRHPAVQGLVNSKECTCGLFSVVISALTYADLFQTPVGMTSVMLHDNPHLFPSPRPFQPERWLQPSKTQLRKYLVPFSRGSRSCLGMKYVLRLQLESRPSFGDDDIRPLTECLNFIVSHIASFTSPLPPFSPQIDSGSSCMRRTLQT